MMIVVGLFIGVCAALLVGAVIKHMQTKDDFVVPPDSRLVCLCGHKLHSHSSWCLAGLCSCMNSRNEARKVAIQELKYDDHLSGTVSSKVHGDIVKHLNEEIDDLHKQVEDLKRTQYPQDKV